jgi:mRNA interferase MazF
MANNIARAEVWMTDFGFGQGREQAGMRHSLIISHDGFNQSAAELIIVIPITSKAKGIRTHVEVKPPVGGLTMISYVKCEDVRSISKDRLVRKLGSVTPSSMASVELVLRSLLAL